MNWGWKITLVYIAFAAMIISFVIRARSNRIDLVTPDYYEQELIYEQKISAQRNVVELDEPPTVKALSGGLFTVQFPSSFSGTTMNGTIHLYCPSDATRDLDFVLALDQNLMQQIFL